MVPIGIFIVAFAVLAAALQPRFKNEIRTIRKLTFAAFVASAIIKIALFWVSEDLWILAAPGWYWGELAFAYVIMKSAEERGIKWTAAFFSAAFVLGLLWELAGVAWGWPFGRYVYNGGLMLFGMVPFSIPIAWGTIVYVCYGITDLLSKRVGFCCKKSLSSALLLCAFDGILAMCLDMMLDPVTVNLPNPGWTWLDGGSFFGIPPGNFFGWFLVACSITAGFRIGAAFGKDDGINDIQSLSYAPAAYFVYFAVMGASAIQIGRPEFLVVGIGTMLPAVAACAIFIFGNSLR